MQWPLERLRGTKLENRDSQLSISKKDSRNRYNWPGIRPDCGKNGNVASNLVTVYIFQRLVMVIHPAEAHLLMSNEPISLLDRFQAFRLDSKRLRSCHTVSHGFSHFTEFPHWGWGDTCSFRTRLVSQDISSQPFGGPRANILERPPAHLTGVLEARDNAKTSDPSFCFVNK